MSADTLADKEIPPEAHSHSQRRGAVAEVNVGEVERIASAATGALLVTLGLRRSSLPGLVLALLGGDLIYRGISGRCHLYEAFGVNTADRPRPTAWSLRSAWAGESQIRRAITISKPAEELYRSWRNPDILARVMAPIAKVTPAGERRQRWRMRMPLGRTIQWEAQIVEDQPGELMCWQSLEGAALPNRGEVRFQPAPANRGTEMTLHMRFDPPGGGLGHAAVKLFGIVPDMAAEKVLRRFKSLVETGEIATLERNPAAR